jgi:DNA polymerase-4
MSRAGPATPILHVDMDAFYAAIEQRDRPELAGLPVIVGADPRGRGVVSTCSYEARRFGVRSAMPIREAARRCPQGVFLPVRMPAYVAESRRIMEILARYSPRVEPLSIDEAFLDVSGCEVLFGPPEAIARRIKTDIGREIRLTCSVGVAPNKFLAKLATELGKPDGLTVIAPERVREVLDPLPVQRVFGVGPRTAGILAGLGIRTVGQIAAADAGLLALSVGAAAAGHMQALARGEDDRAVEPDRLPQQLGTERTFPADVSDERILRRQILDLAGEVGAGLRQQDARARAVRLKVRTEDFSTTTRTRTLARPTDSDRVLYRTACELFDRHPPQRPVRLLGITGADLIHGSGSGDEEQLTLFPAPEADVRRGRLERAADRVRERFGPAALVPAALLDEQQEQPPGPPRRRAPGGGRRPRSPA